MDLNQIKAFASIVETGSFTAAADALGTSKSVVSRALQGLEQDLGVFCRNIPQCRFQSVSYGPRGASNPRE
jgi:hypothetical protein